MASLLCPVPADDEAYGSLKPSTPCQPTYFCFYLSTSGWLALHLRPALAIVHGICGKEGRRDLSPAQSPQCPREGVSSLQWSLDGCLHVILIHLEKADLRVLWELHISDSCRDLQDPTTLTFQRKKSRHMSLHCVRVGRAGPGVGGSGSTLV